MRIWGITDTGLVRRENQDTYRIQERAPSGHAVCVVCDGMGGPAGGRIASGIAADVYLDELERRLTAESTPEEIRDASAEAVAAANLSIRAEAERSRDFRNMGTTLVSAVFCPAGVVITNVGDSRAYYVTGDTIVRVTKDHSLVQEMVDRGDITLEEARRHPQRNLITRALGPYEHAQPDGYIGTLLPDSWLLLCTDGLTETVTDQELFTEILSGGGHACLERLVTLARERGAPDNVTAVLVDNREEPV